MQTNNRHPLLRQLPSVDSLLNSTESTWLQQEFGRTYTLEALRKVLADMRLDIQNGELDQIPTPAEFVTLATTWLEQFLAPTLFPLINATGVIIHTNLGRAPLSQSALTSIQDVSRGYSNLEYDIDSGKRGSRSVHAAELLQSITGTEDAMVVNNNAAGVLLMLSGLCQGRDVIISRGQLVEIGGGFRVPDVMAQSGAHLVEVGTTNRTHIFDYERAITPDTAAILVAHHSNYKIIGFTSEPSLGELAELAHQHDIPLLFDQGSGALIDVTSFGLDHEPTVHEGLQAGADIVTFSGDKLLGGPQAGILCGRKDLIAILKRHPLARAIRADKTCLAGLSATLMHYLRDEAIEEIPVWKMIARSLNDIEAEALLVVEQLREASVSAEVMDGRSRIGGGSLPGSSLPTKLVIIHSSNAENLASLLREAENPVIGRIQEDRLLLDPRTVIPQQMPALLETVIEQYAKIR
ncbi:MAG: L-seryl-tRNA(Sec) selenium transferase [Candidatus Promineifilaceae bacterium]